MNVTATGQSYVEFKFKNVTTTDTFQVSGVQPSPPEPHLPLPRHFPPTLRPYAVPLHMLARQRLGLLTVCVFLCVLTGTNPGDGRGGAQPQPGQPDCVRQHQWLSGAVPSMLAVTSHVHRLLEGRRNVRSLPHASAAVLSLGQPVRWLAVQHLCCEVCAPDCGRCWTAS